MSQSNEIYHEGPKATTKKFHYFDKWLPQQRALKASGQRQAVLEPFSKSQALIQKTRALGSGSGLGPDPSLVNELY